MTRTRWGWYRNYQLGVTRDEQHPGGQTARATERLPNVSESRNTRNPSAPTKHHPVERQSDTLGESVMPSVASTAGSRPLFPEGSMPPEGRGVQAIKLEPLQGAKWVRGHALVSRLSLLRRRSSHSGPARSGTALPSEPRTDSSSNLAPGGRRVRGRSQSLVSAPYRVSDETLQLIPGYQYKSTPRDKAMNSEYNAIPAAGLNSPPALGKAKYHPSPSGKVDSGFKIPRDGNTVFRSRSARSSYEEAGYVRANQPWSMLSDMLMRQECNVVGRESRDKAAAGEPLITNDEMLKMGFCTSGKSLLNSRDLATVGTKGSQNQPLRMNRPKRLVTSRLRKYRQGNGLIAPASEVTDPDRIFPCVDLVMSAGPVKPIPGDSPSPLGVRSDAGSILPQSQVSPLTRKQGTSDSPFHPPSFESRLDWPLGPHQVQTMPRSSGVRTSDGCLQEETPIDSRPAGSTTLKVSVIAQGHRERHSLATFPPADIYDTDNSNFEEVFHAALESVSNTPRGYTPTAATPSSQVMADTVSGNSSLRSCSNTDSGVAVDTYPFRIPSGASPGEIKISSVESGGCNSLMKFALVPEAQTPGFDTVFEESSEEVQLSDWHKTGKARSRATDQSSSLSSSEGPSLGGDANNTTTRDGSLAPERQPRNSRSERLQETTSALHTSFCDAASLSAKEATKDRSFNEKQLLDGDQLCATPGGHPFTHQHGSQTLPRGPRDRATPHAPIDRAANRGGCYTDSLFLNVLATHSMPQLACVRNPEEMPLNCHPPQDEEPSPLPTAPDPKPNPRDTLSVPSTENPRRSGNVWGAIGQFIEKITRRAHHRRS